MQHNVKYPTLKNAPIQEAIISLEIGKSSNSINNIEEVRKNLLQKYPNIKKWQDIEAALEINEKGVNTFHKELDQGYILSTQDAKTFLHIGHSTLALNKLHPYGSWDDFSNEYQLAWNIFTNSLKVEAINNLTVRYINSFKIPVTNWTEYLTMYPALNTLSQYDDSAIAMSELFSKYSLQSEKHMASANVLLTIQPQNTEELKVIMDIEVKSRSGITNYSDYHSIKDTLNRLRAFKNHIFFSNLPKAEEQFS